METVFGIQKTIVFVLLRAAQILGLVTSIHWLQKMMVHVLLLRIGISKALTSTAKRRMMERQSVSLSSDGTTVAIGALYNDGNGSNSGHVRIYAWNSATSAWEQQGADIDGEAADD